MNCVKVRELLSEYIDESLEARTKTLIEEHLSACKDCQQEVASLRMLIDDLGSMETVAPPKDFLDQLHRRMERRSWFSQVLYTLSIPMRVKLPMKLAGAVVMALLVFTILNIQEDQYGTKIAPLMQEPTKPEISPTRMAKIPLGTDMQEETFSADVVREKEKQEPQVMQVAAKRDEVKHLPDNGAKEVAGGWRKVDHLSREESPVEISPPRMASPSQEPNQSESSSPRMAKVQLRTDVREDTDKNRFAWGGMKPKPQTVQVIAQKDEAISLSDNALKRVTHFEKKADHPQRKEAWIELSLVIENLQSTGTFGTASEMEAPQPQEMKVKKRLIMGEPVSTDQQEGDESINHLPQRLREVIECVGGEVVSLEYEEGTHILESVYVEIPAKQMNIFRKDLQTLGELHGTPIGPTGEDEDVLPIRIRLLTP